MDMRKPTWRRSGSCWSRRVIQSAGRLNCAAFDSSTGSSSASSVLRNRSGRAHSGEGHLKAVRGKAVRAERGAIATATAGAGSVAETVTPKA